MSIKEYIVTSESAATVRQRLADAIAWCSFRAKVSDPGQSLRTPEFKPAPLVVSGQQPDGSYIYVSAEDRAKLVRHVCDARAKLLRRQVIVIPPSADRLTGGRLLFSEIDGSDWSGLPPGESQGFFDIEDIPPWDTWVHLEHTRQGDVLLCWVPPQLLAAAGAGIYVSATCSIGWVDRLVLPESRNTSARNPRSTEL